MRRDARVCAFEIVFSRLFTGSGEVDEQCYAKLKKDSEVELARAIVSGFTQDKEQFDKMIEGSLKGYKMERLYKVDLALVYCALSEIKNVKTPAQVVINETLEIAKQYSTQESAKFIHGLLSSIIGGSEK